MWKQFQLTNEEDGPLRRPCGTFQVYAGDILLGRSELELETIGADGFYREGSFAAVLEAYLPFEDSFVRYQDLKLEQHLRLPAYKYIPDLVACEREIQALGLRLVAPNGENVPAQRVELADTGNAEDRELNVFIADETVYARFFPPPAQNT